MAEKKGKLFGRGAPHIHEYCREGKGKEVSLKKKKYLNVLQHGSFLSIFVYSIWDTCKLSQVIYLTLFAATLKKDLRWL